MTSEFRPARIKVQLHGEVIGWFDTLEEAQSALAAAEENEEEE